MMADDSSELLNLSKKLLEAIDSGDWSAYTKLCDPTLTAFEPEAEGNLVEGLDFHKFYFDQPGAKVSKLSSISSPHIRLMGDAATVTYIRLVQRFADGTHSSSATEETRIWQRQNGQWKHVHFHRSPVRPRS